jgi:uncharacterized protein (DUF362 family)
MKSKVSVTRSSSHEEGVQSSLKNLKSNLEGRISDLDQIVIKINFVTTHTELATTPFEAVKEFCGFIRGFYKGEIIIAEEATGGDTLDGFEKYGFSSLADSDEKIKLLDLAEDDIVEKKIVYPDGEIEFPLSKTMVNTPFLVSITRAKTHDAVVATLGIKNVAVGVITGGWGERSNVHQGKYIHNILTEISKIVYPDFVLIDGTVGMEGNGPSSGTPIDSNWVVSSEDALAADSIAAYLMGFDLEDIGYFNLIKEAGLGNVYPEDQIEIVGDYDMKKTTPYKHHFSFESQRLWK